MRWADSLRTDIGLPATVTTVWSVGLPPSKICDGPEGTHLDLYGPQILTDIIRRRLVFGREPRGLFLLFDTECGLGACEVVALELFEQRQDLVVGEQSRALIEDLSSGQTTNPVLAGKIAPTSIGRSALA